MMKFNCLNKSELLYEVAIRGLEPKNTVQGLRDQLKEPVFKQDPLDFPSRFSIEEDLKGCEATLAIANEVLNKLAIQYSDASSGRLSATLTHVDFRLSRIDRDTVGEDVELREWYDHVDAALRKARSQLLVLQSPSLAPPSCQEVTQQPTATPTPVSVTVTCSGTSRLDLRGITYDGKSCVRSFLRKADLLMTSRSITSEQMLRAIPDIFRGEALSVLLAEHFDTWDDLTIHLREVFERPSYDFDLRAEIMARTQGVGETICVFISVMRNYFRLLKTPMSEEDQLEIVSRNLHPSYLPGLGGGPLKNLADLQSRCKEYEGRLWRSKGYVHPPTKPTPMLVPELSYAVLHGSSAASANSSFNNAPPFKNYSDETNTRKGQFSSNPNRHFKHKPLICFGCGKSGFTVNTCTECNDGRSTNIHNNQHTPGTNADSHFASTRVICFKCKSPTHTADKCRTNHDRNNNKGSDNKGANKSKN